MNVSTTIRKADPSETTIVSNLISRSFQDVAARFDLTPENCPTHPSNYTPERARADFERGIAYYLLCESDAPVGLVAIERANQETCYLERLSVLPEHRKKGHGEILVRLVFDEAKKLGAHEVSIAIIAEQTELQQWYEKLGFQFSQRKKFENLPFGVTFMKYALR